MAYKLYGDLEIVSGSTSYGLLKNVAAKANSISTAATKGVKTLSAKGDVGWSNQTDGDANVVSKAFMAYWNGRYNGSSSNLTYAHQGEIQCKPTVLYNNTTGTTGTITLSETSANFTYLAITYYKEESGAGGKIYNTLTISVPNGKLLSLFDIHYANASTHQFISKIIQISGTSITHKYGMLTNIGTNKTVQACEVQNSIYITRVDGYR